MATKTYNINLILILILIVITVWIFFSYTAEPIYHNLSNQKLIEGATTITTEIKPTQGLLLVQNPSPLQTNWGCSFTVKLNNGSNGSWQQIIGITPSQNAEDRRFLGVWLCPNGNTLHIRTDTTDRGNDNIIDCASVSRLNINEYYRFDITSNITKDGTNKQNIIVIMTNITNQSQPQQIANVILAPSAYTKSTTQKVYVFATYSNWVPINGTIKDVVFVTGNNQIVTSNLTNAIGGLNQFAQKQTASIQNGFTTMGGAHQEGLTNIGGIGNNDGIPGISPPTDSVNPSTAINYKPILSSDGLSNICPKSIVQPTDASFNWISQYGYNYPISFSPDGKVSESVPICSPDDLYTVQKQVLKELNDFNAEYSDYMTYLYNTKHSVSGDTTPKLSYSSGMSPDAAATKYNSNVSVMDLSTYKQLSQDVKTYNNLLKANKAYYPDPTNPKDPTTGLSQLDPIILKKMHKNMIDERAELDTKLFELNNVQNSATGESKMQLDSGIYVTLLWTTLATSIIYFVFAQSS